MTKSLLLIVLISGCLSTVCINSMNAQRARYDTLPDTEAKITRLKAELNQVQFQLQQTRFKIDSLQSSLIHQKEENFTDQDYWIDVIRSGEAREKITSAQFLADLEEDKLIKDAKELHSYHLDLQLFKVNGKIQSPEIALKYQQKYLSAKPNGDKPISMSRAPSRF